MRAGATRSGASGGPFLPHAMETSAPSDKAEEPGAAAETPPLAASGAKAGMTGHRMYRERSSFATMSASMRST